MLVLFLILLLAVIAFFKTDVKGKFIKPKYEDVIKSDIDYDSDGLDDYTDILNGAKDFINEKPKYKSKYYDGGYPTDEYRVCTDIIWYALKNAGYDFKTLIDEDIKNNKEEYDEDVTYTIVGSTEVNLAENKISNESPVGAALLGKKKNDMVEVKTPGGIAKYKVLSITK